MITSTRGWGRPKRRGGLLVGVAVGVLVPALSFIPVLVGGAAAATAWSPAGIALMLWPLTAFAGVVMLLFDRTRRLGAGVLLGFAGLLVVGAGACTAVLAGIGG